MNDKPSDRPDPDALLTEVRQREKKSRQGSLKVFFGMCAGVGKTYAMLQEAQALGREGRKILVGNVETHGRPETEALLEGLVTVPRRTLTYRDVTLTEFDLDAVLQQRPDIVLVDELAHHNAPGSRHPKRYQDVEELLDRGISVYTTLNVQHLESRAKTVEDITGAPVRETVPDSFLEHDGEIELVDISPQELRKRLSDGKVYTPEGAKSALQHFFRPGNLTALREMALRVTAEHVDKQMRDSMRRERIPGPWKAGERLMVAVGSSPFSASLIAWTRRMAATMNASWIAVNVETPARLSINQTAQLAGNLRLAQELGAEILTVHASDTVEGLLHAAGQHNITQIVVGKSARGHLVEWLRGGSLVDRLIRRSGNIDIYVVRGDVIHENSKRVPPWPLVSGWRQYGAALAAVAAAVLALLTVVSFINYTAVGMFLLFMITLLSLWLGRGPVLFGAALSA
ncbi:MAG TPA: universal stress protein, partial [bacterium]